MPRQKKLKKDKIAKLLELIEPAEGERIARIVPSCPDFGICGGCAFLDLPYEKELELKSKMVAQAIQADFFPNWEEVLTVPSPKVEGYRNKMEFSFGDENVDGGLALGIRKKKRYYEVAVPTECALIPADFKAIVAETLAYFRQTDETFYHRMRHTGNLRYLVVRRGEFTGEILVNLVTTTSLDKAHVEKWMQALISLVPQGMLQGNIAGILHTASDAVSDAVVPEEVTLMHGRDYFFEKINGLTFRISPFSFFQTNSGGAELLYQTVAEFAGKGVLIYDLYCGTGTIAQVLAAKAEADTVIGIELIAEAVEAAKENARENGLENCRFIAGDVLENMHELTAPPDVLVLDPPRDGIHPKAIGKLIALNAPKVVYVSCKHTSLARDLPFFVEAGYQVKAVRLHDMFCRTPHVETVVLLTRCEGY